MISPEVYLKRPISNFEESRLDRILARAADREVKIFILLYNESSFLTNGSALCKGDPREDIPERQGLETSPGASFPPSASHHEKVVIVDQRMAFNGRHGIFAMGRFDTSAHLIADNDPLRHPGIDYNNMRISDFASVR